MATENAPNKLTFSISFPEVSGKEANVSAASLSGKLSDIDPSLTASRDKVNPHTQDAGAVLNIVLGSAPTAAVAAGIAAWIQMRRVKVRITSKERSIDVSGDGADAARIIEAVFTQK